MKVGLFLEDQAHQLFVAAVIAIVADREQVPVELDVRNAVGGIGRALTSLRGYVRDLANAQTDMVDVLVVAVDGNDRGVNQRATSINEIVERAGFSGRLVCAVPDPHIEAWYLADGIAVAAIAGPGATQAALPVAKRQRDFYKDALREVFQSAGVDPPFGGAEYGAEIARALDMESATRHAPSLRRFLTDLAHAFRELSASGLN